jgi:hypothetical protein
MNLGVVERVRAIGLCTLLAGVILMSFTSLPAAAVPSVNPDEIVYVADAASSSAQLGLVNFDGTGSKTIDISSLPNGLTVGHPVLSPDGSMIVFVADSFQPGATPICHLYVVHSDGTDLREVPSGTEGGCLGDPAWSPDSQRLAFDVNSGQAGQAMSLWTSNVDGSSATELAANGWEPSWSPTGTKIAYVGSTSEGNAVLNIVSSFGGASATVVSIFSGFYPAGESLAYPAWSPDGTQIAYLEIEDTAGHLSASLGLVTSDGRQNRTVGGAGIGPISWCSGGTCVLSNALGYPFPARFDQPVNDHPAAGVALISTINGGLESSVPIGGTDASWIGVQKPTTVRPAPAVTVGATSTATGNGFWTVGSDGGVFTYGDAPFYGSMGATRLNQPVAGMATTPDGGGYWLVASDGGIFSFRDAAYQGSMGGKSLNRPIVGMASDPVTGGYWLVASDGGIFSFGAPYLGSTGALRLNKPIVGMAASPDGGGYWLVASDGGIFAFGTAKYDGSTGAIQLNKPIVGMAATPDGGGYWLLASDGGIFSFGTATFQGTSVPDGLSSAAVALVASSSGGGYREIDGDGGVINFSAPQG